MSFPGWTLALVKDLLSKTAQCPLVRLHGCRAEKGVKRSGPYPWLSNVRARASCLFLLSIRGFVHSRKKLGGSNPGRAQWSLWGLVKILTCLPTCSVRDGDVRGLWEGGDHLFGHMVPVAVGEGPRNLPYGIRSSSFKHINS